MRQLLKDLAVICAGQGAPQGDNNYCENGTPFVKAGNLQELLEGKAITSIQKVSDEVAKKHKLKLYPKGTILFAKSGMSCMKGYVYVLPQSAYVVSHLACVTPNEDASEYLRYFFNYHKPNQLVKDAAYPSISLSDIGNLVVDMKSESERNAIVSVLQHAESVITLRQKELQKLDDLVKARFVEMFGDPKSNPNSYPIGQLSEHIEFLTSGSRGWAQYCVDNGSEWFITIKNVKDCRISIDNMQPINAPDNAEAKRTKVQEGDLLISITADLGRTGVVTKEIADHGAYINQHLTCIRLNKEILNPLYVAFFMESPAGKEQFESKNQSAVKAGLNFNSINSLRLLVPPMDEQSAFVEFVHQVDKSKVVESIHRMNVLFNITLNGGNRYDIRANEF